MDKLFRISRAQLSASGRRNHAIRTWFSTHDHQLGQLARVWFEAMRSCGPDVREALHDGCPVACIEDAPFGYVNVFTSHVNVGFFRGALLPDPASLLHGTGKLLRHVKLRPDQEPDNQALLALITAACHELRTQLQIAVTSSSRRATTMAKTKPASPANNDDWRQTILERVRLLIQKAAPDAVEEIKWRKPSNGMRGVPVWSHGGILCTGETYKNYVKVTFAQGAALPDPAGLFNASLTGGTRRAIDLHAGDKLNEKAFQALIRAAVELNLGTVKRSKPSRTKNP
jgi:hypothetical protein